MPGKKKIAVIGGGIAGLSGAIGLAARGYNVSIYEKSKSLGGKMNRIIQDGFTFDTGPSLLTMPDIFNAFFNALNIPSQLDFIPIDPICRYNFADNSQMDAFSDLDQMQSAIESISSEDVNGFRRFMTYSKTIHDLTADVFMYTPFQELQKILKWKFVPTLLQIWKIDPFSTVHRSVCRFYKDPRLIQLFDRYPTYNGSSPYLAPATLNIIPYVEHGFGGFYLKGGLYTLVERLHDILKEMGVAIHLNTNVNKILHDGSSVKGIQIGNEKADADIVLCNADIVTTHQHMIDDFETYSRRLSKLEPSLSGIVFFWGVEGNYSQLQQHNIFFSSDYPKEFNQIFVDKVIPQDPTIYIAITQKRDQTHAPDGCENWFVLVNAPYLADGQDWDHFIKTTRQNIFNRLKTSGLDIENKIRFESVMTPVDFEKQFGSNRGSIYGIASNNMMSAFLRPPNRSRKLKGLYFAGGSSHPGGGVPLTFLSGKIAADLISEYEL